MKYGLYYPNIEFRDIDYIKRSLLVWDRIFRIVPPSYTPYDDAEIDTAISQGTIVNLTVDEYEKSKTAHEFLEFYRLRKQSPMLGWPAGMDSSTFVNINPEKIEARLLPLFEMLSKQINKDGFMEIPAEIAGGYMFYLANNVAKQRNLQLMTDSPDSWVAGSYFAHNGNFSDEVYKENGNAYLCNLAITDLLPDRLDHLSIDQILSFVEKHKDERSEFQNELEKFRMEVSRCNNKEHAKYIANDFKKDLEKAKNEYKKSIRFFSKRDLCSIFSGGVSTTLSVLSLPLAPGASPYDPIHLGAGLLFGAVSALAARSLIPENKGTASYLISLDKLSNTPSYQLYRTFHEFVND